MPASKSLNYPVHSSRPKVALYAAVAFSLLAALIHLWAMPEHFEEWWGYGTFFLVSAIVQGFYGAALLRWPRRPLLLLGIGGNLSIVALYLLTRTVRIPFFGPHAGEVEGGRGRTEMASRGRRRTGRFSAPCHPELAAERSGKVHG